MERASALRCDGAMEVLVKSWSSVSGPVVAGDFLATGVR